MPVFNLQRSWSGYSRGYTTVQVVAETLDEAIASAWGLDGEDEVVRDDRDYDEWEEA